MQGATTVIVPLIGFETISIHAPYAGSDERSGDLMIRQFISIHAPYAGSDHFHKLDFLIEDISIHAPYAGSDGTMTQLHDKVIFQSTLPMQGATRNLVKLKLTGLISIHAPYAGSDLRQW